jgi:hypothetical protein
VPTGTPTRFIASAFFVCLLTGSAWANGIKHPSDYGSPPSPINFTPCGSQLEDGVVASCFEGTGPSSNDFLFTFALQNPSALTSITSVTFTLTDVPTDFGLLKGTAADCGAMNIACTPAQVTIPGNQTPVIGANTFLFNNFTGDLQVTEFFAYANPATAPVFTAATTSSTTATPEPSEIGLLTVALATLIMVRRRQQTKQNS